MMVPSYWAGTKIMGMSVVGVVDRWNNDAF